MLISQSSFAVQQINVSGRYAQLDGCGGACWALQDCPDVCWEWIQWCCGKESHRILGGENSWSLPVVGRTQKTWAPVTDNCGSVDHTSWGSTFHKILFTACLGKPWTQLSTPDFLSREPWTDPLEFLSKITLTLQTESEFHFPWDETQGKCHLTKSCHARQMSKVTGNYCSFLNANLSK